ncbi:MAG: RsmB/NOP family class I SAM-dependent RNA methyltransferase [Euryarchaeota archaeon]|nr:RsmB/NOP family class I SAM-dependent RNA methyltransferase [Euryarchaeota archaeon]
MVSDFLRERYARLFGEGFLRHLKDPVRPALRVNTLRTDEGTLVERLRDKGFRLEKVPWTGCGYWIESSPFSPGATTEYLLGHYLLQDPASQYACETLGPRKDDLVLDMAAAPGGKTTHLAQLLEGTGTVVALDISRQRMRSLRSNLSRMGVENCLAFRMDARDAGELGLEFDRVLLDAPCTGTGTAFKNPEALEKDEKDLEKTVPLQLELIKAGAGVLKKGGTLLYCTCSFLPEEGEMVVARAVGEHGLEILDIGEGEPGLSSPYGMELPEEVERTRRFFPHRHGTQGFYMARLRKV